MSNDRSPDGLGWWSVLLPLYDPMYASLQRQNGYNQFPGRNEVSPVICHPISDLLMNSYVFNFEKPVLSKYFREKSSWSFRVKLIALWVSYKSKKVYLLT